VIICTRNTKLLSKPILKSELCTDKLLRELAVIKMPRGRNPFKISKEEWCAVEKILENRKVTE
jgi:hypothetical protein